MTSTERTDIRTSRLGDCLRALSTLQPADDAAGAAIIAALGIRARTLLPSEAPTLSAEVFDDDEPGAEVPGPESPLSHPIGDDDPLPPAREATLVALDQRAEAAPDWLRRVVPMPRPDRVANPFRGPVSPLFEPKWQRAIITRLAATWQPGNAIDVDDLVAHMATGRPLRTVPRLSVRTAQRGVRILVDQGESMQPFQLDVAQLLRAFRRTLGPSRLRIEGFRGLPNLGVSSGPVWHDFEARRDTTPIVVVSDLGLPPCAPLSVAASTEEWRRFFARLAAQGTRATAVVPRAARLLPRVLSRHAWMVPWDRSTNVSRLGATMAIDGFADADPGRDLQRATDDLACACALAIRIEPSLLRSLRHAVVPRAGVEVEAALWFDDRVADRAPTGIVIADEARPTLLARLRNRSDLATVARAIVAQAHEDAPAAVRLEEQATWYWFVGDFARASEILKRMVATVVSPERGDAWRWAARAVERLPPALMASEEGQMLALGTAVRSGESTALQSVSFGAGRDWHWLRPTTPRTDVAVTMRVGAIEFGPVTARSRTTMQVPSGKPASIDIVPDGHADRIRRIRVQPSRRTLVPIEGDRFDLAVIGGDRYRLEEVRSDAADAKQRFVSGGAAPRVEIAYQVEWYGAEKAVELPFVIGVLADLGGRRAEPRRSLADRHFVLIDIDNFDAMMANLKPRVAFAVADPTTDSGTIAVDLVFASLTDFAPAAVARRIEPLRRLLDDRGRIQEFVGYLDGRVHAQELIEKILQTPSLLVPGTPGTDESWPTRLQRLLKPASADAWQRMLEAMQAAAGRLATAPGLFGHDATESLLNVVADLDARLTAQLNPILHHEDFRTLEGAWRGLHFLVAHSDTGPMLKIRVLDVTKAEVGRDLRRHAGDTWDQGSLFRKIHEEEFGFAGGEPYGCLIADFAFDHRVADLAILGGLARIAEAGLSPLIASAAPGLLQIDEWRQLALRRQLESVFATAEYAAWHRLREAEESRWVCLALPRFLARTPYGSRDDPVEEFAFEEDLAGDAPDRFVWANAAYAMGTNIARAFAQFGWCARIRGIESGGGVTGMALHRFPTDDGGMPVPSSTEVVVTDRREAELARAGLMPLLARRGSDTAYFLSAQSLMKPSLYDDAEAQANAALLGRLPFLLAIGRFSQFVKCMARDRIGSFADAGALQATLQRWLDGYVDPDPEHSSESAKARRPLAEARIAVEAENDRPGIYRAAMYLRPHYQLEGLTTSSRVVTMLFADPLSPQATGSSVRSIHTGSDPDEAA